MDRRQTGSTLALEPKFLVVSLRTGRTMILRSSKTTLGMLSILCVCVSGQAATILTANITNAAENPPTTPTTSTGAPRPASFGTGTFVLNDAMTSMTMSVTIFNIDFTGLQTVDVNDNLAAAHIHASPTATTVNAPVVWGFFGSPFNDNNPNDTVVTPFATGVGGMITGKWDAPEGNGAELETRIDLAGAPSTCRRRRRRSAQAQSPPALVSDGPVNCAYTPRGNGSKSSKRGE